MSIIRRLIGAVLASFEIGRSAFAAELVNQGSGVGNPEHALKVFAKFFNGQQAQHRIPVQPSMRRG